MNLRLPTEMKLLGSPGAVPFAIMAALNSSSLAVMSTVLALKALEQVGTSRNVSLIYMAVAAGTLVTRFAIPEMIRRLRRRWVYTGGILAVGLSPLLIATNTIWGQIAGMTIQVFGGACANINLNLYVMDYIAKKDFVKSEPLKLAFTGLPWALGPTLGVWLYHGIDPWAAYVAAMVFSGATLAYFWFLRLTDNPTVAAMKRPPPNPLRYLRRFFVEQPRLRLAWLIAFGRDIWWQVLMIYGPLYVVTKGLPEDYAGYLVSLGLAMLFLGPLHGRIGSRFGLRRSIMAAFAVGAFAMAVVLALYHHPLAACAALLIGTGFTTMLDAVGGIPFLRAVHAYERPEMTMVYTTFGNAARFACTAVFSVLLSFFPLEAVFVVTGIALVLCAWLARHVPRTM